MSEFSGLSWRKAKRCHANGTCVEVARAGRTVRVRESKDIARPSLGFSGAAWRRFVEAVEAR